MFLTEFCGNPNTRGVKGLVTDTRGKAVPNAAILVLNPDGKPRGKNMLSSLLGEYWRILLPGTYRLVREFFTLQFLI